MTHVWWWRSRLPERNGQVRFADGVRVVASRYAVRKARRR